MENVVLIIHLLLALTLIGVVLLQRSEGGGLGIGGGGGGGGVMSSRGAATALGKVTWLLAIAFISTSILLTVIAARNAEGTSVVDRITDRPAAAREDDLPLDGESLLPGAGESLLPPAGDSGEGLLPGAGDSAPVDGN
ncbi:MAG: preprotein translocase subunit SecG [Rhodobacteraceae bacterium HLUCCA08]|nr:MAG: preprotein translocase subunit SecG [Rhodobacteraceae bacterium HLUCCA08]